MPNRILKESICRSANIEALSDAEESFFYRLMVQCDDYGIFDGRPAVIKGSCYPLKKRVTEGRIEAMVAALVSAGLVNFYEVNDQPYIRMLSWSKHQQIRARRSKYPDETGAFRSGKSQPSDGNQLIADDIKCPRNPIQSESNPNPITSSASDAGHQHSGDRLSDEFEAWWSGTDGEPPYPRRVNKKKAGEEYASVRKNKRATKEQLAIGKRHYSQTVANEKTAEKFVVYPSTWLHQERWVDYQEPPKLTDSSSNDEETDEMVAQYWRCISAARSCQTDINLERQRDVLTDEDKQKISDLQATKVRNEERAADIKQKLEAKGIVVNEKERRK